MGILEKVGEEKLLAFAEKIESAVQEKFGVELELEPVILS